MKIKQRYKLMICKRGNCCFLNSCAKQLSSPYHLGLNTVCLFLETLVHLTEDHALSRYILSAALSADNLVRLDTTPNLDSQ